MPREVEGLLAAGPNLSCDPQSHKPLREVPECWVMGPGRRGATVRHVPLTLLRDALRSQGALLGVPAQDPVRNTPI